MDILNRPMRLLLIAAALASGPAQADFGGPLNSAAMQTHLTTQRPLNAVVQAGTRLIAAGPRGHIIYSDDEGKSWKQADVPVSSDLTALWFSSESSGWAVGHDGVVLHSDDAGAHWQLQLDGHRVDELMRTHYGRLAAAGNTDAEALLPEIEQFFSAGPDKPFLDVWFADEKEGFIVGAFNMIFHTADGGQSWEPWFERVDNPRRLHLYSIRGKGESIYIAGELGLVAVLDAHGQRFKALSGPYAGSFFGVQPVETGSVVFGMRGSAYHIAKDGVSWTKLETGVAGGLTGAVALDGNRLALVSTGGDLLVGSAEDGHFERLPALRAMAFAGLAYAPVAGKLVLVGSGGLAVVAQKAL